VSNKEAINPHRPPLGLTRSGVACWWSIYNLISESVTPCYLWTLTFKEVYPYSYYGNMHRSLVAYLINDDKRGYLGPDGFAAVRVIEEHPGGHGLHYHWIVKGRMPINRVRLRAEQCGFGRINIAQDKKTGRVKVCDVGAAGYLAKYLTKNEKLPGVRAWACLGRYKGVATKDIEFRSKEADVFRAAYREGIRSGMPRNQAFTHATKEAAGVLNKIVNGQIPVIGPRLGPWPEGSPRYADSYVDGGNVEPMAGDESCDASPFG